MEIQSILKSRLTTALLTLAFIAVAFITLELYRQKVEVDNEIARLQQQADTLNHDNQQLSELIKYLDTPEFQEKEAREKLNLKREGEQVVILPEDDGNGHVAGAAEQELSNPQKWFNYFFGQP